MREPLRDAHQMTHHRRSHRASDKG
uniref:Uncharacterized protein n=1 Tax=Anguilla anguilla TaxID=7936 RepID=A0A0E9VSI7_ANGAN